MQRVIFLGSMLLALAATSVANAATVYFRGAITTTIGADVLGLSALPNQNFEALVTTNNGGGVLGNYIVFQGRSFNFTTGTFGPSGGNNLFSGLNLVSPTLVPSGVLTITIPGPVVADSQAGMDSLIGRPGGTAIITIGGTTYIGGITAVPEPTTLLALTGLVGCCGAYGWRKRRKIENI